MTRDAQSQKVGSLDKGFSCPWLICEPFECVTEMARNLYRFWGRGMAVQIVSKTTANDGSCAQEE